MLELTEAIRVFWVVSVPLAILLAILFLTPAPKWLKGQWNKFFKERSDDERRDRIHNAPPASEAFENPDRSKIKRPPPRPILAYKNVRTRKKAITDPEKGNTEST